MNDIDSNGLSKIENISLEERSYTQLRSSILLGHFRPGEKITMRGLASKLGTSVQPIRAALTRLCAEGAIEMFPNRLCRIRMLDKERLSEIWHIRILLESEITALSAARITKGELQQVHDIDIGMRDAIRKNLLVRVLQLNYEWHFCIYSAASSLELKKIIENLWLQVAPIFSALLYYQSKQPGGLERMLPLHERHDELFLLLNKGDESGARKSMKNALINSRKWLMQIHERGGLNIVA